MKNPNVPFVRLFVSSIVGSSLALSGGCRPTASGKDKGSDTAAAAEMVLRDQGANGTCWLYAYGSLLNQTLVRQQYRRARGNPEAGAFWEQENGKKLTFGQYAVRLKANSGEMAPHADMPNEPSVAKMPRISINALIYAHYMQRLSEWLGTPWPYFFKFDADGGYAEAFDALYKKGLLTENQFPDGDFAKTELDERVRSSLCEGKPRSACNPTSIVEIVNQAGLYKKDPALQKELIRQLLEEPYRVPQNFRVIEENGKLRYPILEAESHYRSPSGVLVPRKDLAPVVWRLPEDIELWEWARGYAGSSTPARIDLWKRWGDQTGLSFPSAQEMAELSAMLVRLNQPLAFSAFAWSREGLAAKEVRPQKNGSDAIGAHAMLIIDSEVADGALVLRIRNSWGSSSADLRFTQFEKQQWDASLPRYLWEQVIAAYASVRSGDCGALPENTYPLAAAFKHLKERGYRSSGNSMNDKLLALAERCAPAGSDGQSAPRPVACPTGFHAETVGNGLLCSDGSNAWGPFTDAMIAKCLAWGGGETVCKSERWAWTMARDARGTAPCPLGASPDSATGYCTEGTNAFGPFPTDLVEKCKASGGGAACASARWSLPFLKSLLAR